MQLWASDVREEQHHDDRVDVFTFGLGFRSRYRYRNNHQFGRLTRRHT